MLSRLSPRRQTALLTAWHAWLAGSFLVAYLSADEDTYAIHQFAGYAVLAAIAARLAAGLFVRSPGPWRLPRPSWRATRQWLAKREGRAPLFALFAAALLAVVGLVALSGTLADGASWMEDPHEAIAEASVWLIASHIAFVTYIYAGRKRLAPLIARLRPGHRESLR